VAILGLVAAGAEAGAELQALGVKRIPLLRTGGETLLARACRCLIQGGGCREVIVVAPDEVPLPEPPAGTEAQISRGYYDGQIIDNLAQAVRHRLLEPGAGPIDGALLSSSDMPLIEPEAIAALLAVQAEHDADVVYPAIEKGVILQAYPEAHCSFYRLGGLQVTGGNVVYLNPHWLLEREQALRELFAARKDLGAMARFFGPLFLLKVAGGSAALPEIERVVGGKLGGKLKAAVLPFPGLGLDLDKPADLELFKPLLDPWEG
jgi:hypothetical protein